MSIRSKAKRDARRKKAASASRTRLARPMQEHAHLIDGEGRIFGGAGLHGQQWAIVLGGKVVARTESAAMTIAMLKHVAGLQESHGEVRLSYSTQLSEAATAEAAAEGKTLDEFLAQLEAERQERNAPADGEPGATSDELH